MRVLISRAFLHLSLLVLSSPVSRSQGLERRVGSLREVFAWRQLTYDLDGQVLLQDRFAEIDAEGEATRDKRQSGSVFFNNLNAPENESPDRLSGRPDQLYPQINRPQWQTTTPRNTFGNRPTSTTRRTTTANLISSQPADESRSFFIQYNNVPMGVERVGNRLFVTVPRRRYGIPSTLNYIDLTRSSNTRSPALKPYPDLRTARSLVSIYRTRADECGRLWAVDTGLLEIPNNRQQVRPPSIVIFDLKTNRQILRYELKSTDLRSESTPAGLASITIDIMNSDCQNAYAYIPDLVTNGIVVFSLRENDSWRMEHNYLSFNPSASTLNIAGQRFQWNDGIFSIALGSATGNCRIAYFHPMVSTNEFSVSTCILKDRNAANASDFWTQFNDLGERGINTQSTMHDYHPLTGVLFFAEIGRNSVSCWNTGTPLSPTNVAILAQDSTRLIYPSDIHVTGDEVWVMSNTMPRFSYSRLDTNEYNFYIYRGSVQEMIANTPCSAGLTLSSF